MSDTYIFRRIEKKYILDGESKRALMSLIGAYLSPDPHGISTVYSLDLDTPDYRLIRNSMDAVSYKEKLRIRSYGIPTGESRVFLEIKKKYEGVVYKRRITMSCDEALSYVRGGDRPCSGQIMNEIDWSMHYYGMPSPRTAILYERKAFDVPEQPGLRLTFDSGVRYRTHDVLATDTLPDVPILPPDMCVFEIKTEGAMPVCLSAALEKCGIYPASFSKYGRAYIDMQNTNTPKGDIQYA